MERIGKYRIIGELGKGGFGVVYRAFDATVGREVAVKLLSAPTDPDLIRRFHAEAMTSASFHHKNIVVIHEFGEENGMRYLVMEYLQGSNLQELITQKVSISLLEKLRIMSEVAQGLKCAHEHGVVHRDVKPANIMRLVDGSVKIMDFGIARLMKSTGRLTQVGLVIGTPQYMAPEQFSTGDADALCDIWSYGVVLYELLTGVNPFLAPDAPSIIHRVTTAPIEPVNYIVPDCPRALSGIMERLLMRTREERYQSMEDVVLDLESLMHELGQVEVAGLIESAEKLIQDGALEQAQSVVRRILELEPANAQARKWRESLREQERRRLVREKVQKLIHDAQADASQRNFEGAIAKLNSAAALDPTSGDITARIEQVRAEKETIERVERLISEARNELRHEALTSAFEHANEAAKADPGNTEATALLASVRQAMEERDARVSRQAALSKARGLILMQAYDEALPLLEDLGLRYPQDVEVRDRLAEAKQLRETQLARQKLEAGIRNSQDLLRTGSYQAAAELLRDLEQAFPKHEQILSLLSYAREQIELERLAREAEGFFNEAATAHSNRDFDRALASLDHALRLSPGKDKFLRLRENVVAAQRQEEEDRAKRRAVDACRALLEADRLEMAAAGVRDLLAKFRRTPEIAELEADLQRRLQKQREAQEKRQQLERAEKYLAAGQPVEATRLLNDLKVRYPSDVQVPIILERAAAMEKEHRAREAAAQCVAELERRLTAHEIDSAIELGEASVKEYPFDSRLPVLLQRAREERRLANLLTSMDRALLAGNLEEAERLAREIPEHAARDERWLARQRIIAARRHTADEVLRADECRKRGDIQGARELARRLAAGNPDDPSVRALVKSIEQDAEAWEQRRQAEQAIWEAAELTKHKQFGAAIQRLEVAVAAFPRDAVLQTELDRTRKARDLNRINEEYARGRSEIQAHLAKHEFDEAVGKIRRLLAQFPNDPLLLQDLEVAGKANQVRSRRLQMESEIAELERLFHAGDAEAVHRDASRLLKEGEEPRVRELFAWADAALRQTRTIRREVRGPSRLPLYVAGAVAAAAILGLGIYFFTPPHGTTATFTASPSELTFTYEEGKTTLQPQTFSVKGITAGAEWNISASDPWIEAEAAGGDFVSVAVRAEDLTTGDYSGVISVSEKNRAVAPVNVRVRLRITREGVKGSVQPPVETKTKPTRLPANPKSEIKQAEAKPPEAKQPEVKQPEAAKKTEVKQPEAKQPEPKQPDVKAEAKQPNGKQTTPSTTAAVQPENPPPSKALPPQPPADPIVNCHAIDYPGLQAGTIQWSGSLPMDGELTLDRRNRIVSGPAGSVRGDRLPGCEVTITLLTPGIALLENPNRTNGFGRLTLKNASPAPVSAIGIRWQVK